MKKSVRKLLEPYERPGLDVHHAAAIVGLPAATAKALLGLLPPEQLEDRVSDNAPTLRGLVGIALQVDGAVLSGFRIGPDRLDERITLTRVTIPHSLLHFKRVSILEEAAGPSPIKVGMDGSIYADWS